MSSLPEYEKHTLRMVERRRLAVGFARQIELTTAPFLDRPFADCRVLDIGCGYGYTAAELAKSSRQVVGIEPNAALVAEARERAAPNLEIRHHAIGELDDTEGFDVAVLDNVLEHLEDQVDSLRRISRCLKPGGVAFILVPNKLWPIEAHYGLPFLSYLPLPLANRYLRLSRRGTDYQDASYAPSYRRLRRLLADRPELDSRLTLPADVSLAEGGGSRVYTVGVAALRRWPLLWAISKAFLVVAKKRPPGARDTA
jgi:2-polyprenyl-3-methyl-5-hydroxy-6-metoxy-1,4-benzoquinol methylase